MNIKPVIGNLNAKCHGVQNVTDNKSHCCSPVTHNKLRMDPLALIILLSHKVHITMASELLSIFTWDRKTSQEKNLTRET